MFQRFMKWFTWLVFFWSVKRLTKGLKDETSAPKVRHRKPYTTH